MCSLIAHSEIPVELQVVGLQLCQAKKYDKIKPMSSLCKLCCGISMCSFLHDQQSLLDSVEFTKDHQLPQY